ncbi:sulfotransferase family protein [Salinimicrobium sp. TH3]|uniref:sulfotransferase family protein n=1 Tax=Salinimicrobium sp. TH3 TaxID=2997342 RepID=UPI002276448F|nr:sulfotransferase [Salinimicrobium sp. TH3]MCY2686946.1 sulfotransferase [Salinimicrobium sp. TH3]
MTKIGMDMRPDFLVVGATKAGTTTLQGYLGMHPEIYMHPNDLHFFSDDGRYSRGSDWYRAQFSEAAAYTAVGEKSPTYSWDDRAPDRIYAYDPDVKLVWILREPIARAHSHYWQMVWSGGEYMSFEQCFYHKRHCIQRSVYADQVERYLALWPVEQMYFLTFENMISNPLATMNGLFDFLGVPPRDSLRDEVHARKATKYPRYPWINYPFVVTGAHGRVAQVIRSSALRLTTTPKKTKIDPGLRDEMEAFFAPHNERLNELVGVTYRY